MSDLRPLDALMVLYVVSLVSEAFQDEMNADQSIPRTHVPQIYMRAHSRVLKTLTTQFRESTDAFVWAANDSAGSGGHQPVDTDPSGRVDASRPSA